MNNPNQIIAALLDVASAAFAVNHSGHRWPAPPVTEMEVRSDDLAALEAALLRLEEIPMAEHETYTGPARARIALSSFLTGTQDSPVVLEAGCWICADTGHAFGKVCDHPTTERRVRPRFVTPTSPQRDPTEATINRLINDQKIHGDADLLGKLRDLCGFVENGSDETVSIYQDDATRDWTLRIGSDSISSKCRRYRARSFHQAIVVAAEAEVPKEPCAFCGATVADPCDEPPSDICEKGINATYGNPLTGKTSVEPPAPPPARMIVEGVSVGRDDVQGDEVMQAVVIDLDRVAMTAIRDAYVEAFGPLDPNITGNDIDWHIREIIKEARARYTPDADEAFKAAFVGYQYGTEETADAKHWFVAGYRVAAPVGLAEAIHYPDHWDTATYPSLADALHEVYADYKCTDVSHHALIYPDELNHHLKVILGTMCFQVIQFMPIYRASGFEIATRAEDEQAFMLDRLLRAYLIHGDKWEAAINTEMRELHAKLKENKS